MPADAVARPRDADVTRHLDDLAVDPGELVRAMDTVIDSVASDFFARVLRPFLDPIRVLSRTYAGPAPAHLPFPVVDVGTLGIRLRR